jgi:hypothetical protein
MFDKNESIPDALLFNKFQKQPSSQCHKIMPNALPFGVSVVGAERFSGTLNPF